MRLFILFVFAVIVFSSCKQGQPSTSTSSKLEASVDSLAATYLNVDTAKIAGMGIAIYKGDEKLLLKGYGFADLEFDVKMPPDASFEIGSVTKQFTSAAILQLAEQGKISLDDDFTKYVRFDTKGKKVTVRQLMNHTSGIKGYTELEIFEQLAPHKYKRDTLLRIVEKEKFDFEPGEALIYNNTAFFILGLIIEKVSGTTYEDYVQRNLFEKAGMTNSFYCNETKVVKNRAHGYNMGEMRLRRADYIDHTWPYSAGSLCSTPEDLVKWNNALHHGKILSEKMYAEFLAPAILNDGTITHYAKGITVTEKNGRTMIEHGGGIPGFLSANRYYPEEDVKIVVLANTTGPVSPDKIAREIEDILFGKAATKAPLYNGDLTKFEGTYKGRGRGTDLEDIITKNDSTLIITVGKRKPKSLSYVKDNTWTDGSATYMFKSTGDAINELRIDQVYGYLILKR